MIIKFNDIYISQNTENTENVKDKMCIELQKKKKNLNLVVLFQMPKRTYM